MTRRLRLLGIDTLGQLASLPVSVMSNQFGVQGYVIRQLAAGRDNQPIVPYVPKVSEHAIRHLDSATSDRPTLEAILSDIAEELASCLYSKASMGRELELTVRLDGGAVRQHRITLRQPVAMSGHLAEIYCQLLARMQITVGVIQLEAQVADLVPAVGKQLDLFIHEAGQERLLRNALRDVMGRYGADCFQWITLADPEARLPGRRFKLRRADEI
ncbi:MAG: hypothetical protein IT323_18615 [Anaerolineae bacterium]|nr:hypothetical protein [Anaerolineae bacterium]